MYLYDHGQQYIMNPSLLIQFLTANLGILIFSPLVLAIVVFVVHLIFFVWLKYSDILKLNIGEAALSIFGAIAKGAKGSWVTPLTSIGGVLGILVLLQTSVLFTNLSALFGIILLFAPLVPKIIEGNKLSNCLGNSIATILTLWAVFGELFAAILFLTTLNLTSSLLTDMFRAMILLSIGMTCAYVIKWHLQQRVQHKATPVKEPHVLKNSIELAVEKPELSHLQ